jgi:penicillin amidase
VGAAATAAGCIALLWLISGCAFFSYLGYRVSPSYPKDESQLLSLPGLRQDVNVYIDAWGIPHIEAEEEEDLLRATGFMHGRNRFFQMDVLRRVARGRLSELVGSQPWPPETTVELDIAMRGWGLERKAKEDAARLRPGSLRLMKAYVAGVNRALALYPPVEYEVLRVDPMPWAVEDSFAVGRLLIWIITQNWQQETSRLLLALEGGVDRAEKIYPSSPWPGPTSLEVHGAPKELPPAVVPEIKGLFPLDPVPLKEAGNEMGSFQVLSWLGPASNSWIVGGARTASGSPLLANDPHLPHLLPSIMFQQHLRCKDLDVIGATVPGIPYVFTGHNNRVAWGITSAAFDAADLYIEKLGPEDPVTVAGPAGPEPLITEELVVRVRDGISMSEITHTLRRTKRGPLLNDIYPSLLPEGAPLISIRWIAEGASGGFIIQNLADINRASTVADLKAALGELKVPLNAVVAADVDGDVALFATGAVPIRMSHRGTFPVPAWVSAYAWSGEIQGLNLPASTDRPDYFAHGNNIMADSRFLLPFVQVDSAPSYRFERIVELLRESEGHTKESTAKIQADTYSLRGQRVCPFFIRDIEGLSDKSPLEEVAFRLLRDWDYSAHAASQGAVVFFAIYQEMLRGALSDELDSEGLRFLLAERFIIKVSDLWIPDADHVVWDDRATPSVEGRPEVVRRAFRGAVTWLSENLNADPQRWSWGAVHRLKPTHFLGSSLGAFNLESFGAPGETASVWKGHFDASDEERPFSVTAGPVYRMIVDLADLDHAWWIIDTGASGWPLSLHYGDQYDLWRRGDYIPMVMDWQEIRDTAIAELQLR